MILFGQVHNVIPFCRSSRSPAKQSRSPAPKNLFCSPSKEAKPFKTPVKPALKARTPCKSPSIHPNKANLFPSASPKRVTVNQLEDLLCSPVKSPVRKVEVARSPRKPASPMKQHEQTLSPTDLYKGIKSENLSSIILCITSFSMARYKLYC